jgi:hypothetical protein
VIIEPGLSPDQSREINHLPAGRGYGEGQESVQEIVQALPTGVDGHDTAAAAAAGAQQNVEVEHPPHQGRP